ncbi:MAG: GGDEF domain-containing protein [Cyanobium sp.]|nr:GGDEF domain-containing protein [Cyanobium sp.]
MIRARLARLSASPLLQGRVNRSLWLEVILVATGASTLMAVLAGALVLMQGAEILERDARDVQRQLSVALTSHQPLYNLQRQIQQISSTRPQKTSALVVDQRGMVLAASNNAMVGLALSAVLTMPRQAPLKQLFADCPSASALLACLSRDTQQFQGPLPWIGGETLSSRRRYPLALEGNRSFGDHAMLITVIDASHAGPEALRFIVWVFLAGLLPLLAGCVGLVLRLRQRLIPQLLQLAQVDALSGIFNRRAFLEIAADLLERAEPLKAPMTLALVDIDHFKQINDTHGHDAGDEVIRRVADVLRGSIRSNDLVGRLGGDEFVILVQLPAKAAMAMLRRMLAHVCDLRMDIGADKPVRVSLSIGVASSGGPGGFVLSELMSNADAALYVAKDRGRAQVVDLELEAAGSGLARAVRPLSGEWQVRGV